HQGTPSPSDLLLDAVARRWLTAWRNSHADVATRSSPLNVGWDRGCQRVAGMRPVSPVGQPDRSIRTSASTGRYPPAGLPQWRRSPASEYPGCLVAIYTVAASPCEVPAGVSDRHPPPLGHPAKPARGGGFFLLHRLRQCRA